MIKSRSQDFLLSPSRHLFCRLCLLIAPLAFAFLPPSGSSRAYTVSIQAQEARALGSGAAIRREIAGGNKHTYSLTLASGQFLSVKVDQQDIDIFIKLVGPDGRQLAMARNYLDPMRLERFSFISDAYGDYLLEVIAPGTGKGSYELRADVRVVTPEDQSLIAAEKLSLQAEQLLLEGKAESIRQAISKYEQSLALWQQSGDSRGQADALQFLSVAYQRTGEIEKPLEYLLHALSLYRAIGDRRGESQALQGMGLMTYLSGNPHRALEYYNHSLPLSRELKDRGGQATTLNNIGIVYYSMGEQQKALDHYALSLPLQQSLGNKVGEGVTLNNIGEIYRTLGERDRALEYFEKSLLLRRETRDLRGEGVTLNNIGLIQASMGDYKKALDELTQSLAIRRTVGDRFGEAATLNNTGWVHYKLGDYNKAAEFFSRGLELRRAIADRRGEAHSLHLLGAACFSMGETEKAIAFFNQSLPLSRSVKDRAVEATNLYSIARIERDRGHLALASTRMNAALEIIESLRSMVAGHELRETFFASKQDHYELYVDILMRLDAARPSAGYAARAFEIHERARGRALLDILTESRADLRHGIDPSLVERERALQQQINSKEALRMQMSNRSNTGKQLQMIETALADLLNQHKDIRAQIRTANPRYAALNEPQPLDLEEIQKLLDPHTVLLEYSLGEGRSYLWLVTQTSIKGHTLAGREEIERRARRAYELLTARNQRLAPETSEQKRARVTIADDQYKRVATELSRMLIYPVAEEIGNRRLLIVSQGALHYIPFAALSSTRQSVTTDRLSPTKRKAEESYRPLVADHEIIHLPSASTLALLRDEITGRKQPDKMIAVLADPVFDINDPRVANSQARTGNRQLTVSRIDSAPSTDLERSSQDLGISSFRRLKFSRQEAESISALAHQSHTLKAVDFAASRATAISEDLSRYRIIHFATHGLINTRHPELSGVVFSLVDENGQPQDGFLRLHEIYNLKLKADLVVLSACRSALGKEVKGEGLVGLTRGFMYAGTNRVVASLWEVEDRATAELMKRFYSRLLKENLRPAAALRAAQVEMFDQRQWLSPYYWAGFIIQGEWR